MKIDKEIVLVALLTLLVALFVGYVTIGQHSRLGVRWGGDGWRGQDQYMDVMMDDRYGTAPRSSWLDNDDHQGHMMGMVVTSEQQFIEEMIPHHQEAVDTAKEVLERGGTTPDIKALAENIVRAQEQEIVDMKQWYQDWYGVTYQDKGMYQPMMRELADLSGVAIDRAFLSDMIMHHMGAIMMARSVTPYLEHQEMTDLTKAIVTTQSDEMVRMRTMLAELE